MTTARELLADALIWDNVWPLELQIAFLMSSIFPSRFFQI